MSTRKKIAVKRVIDSIDDVTEILGAGDGYILRPSPLNDSNKQSISFCSDTTENAREAIRGTKAKVVICYDGLTFTKQDYKDKTLILTPDPRVAFVQILRSYFEEKVRYGISPTAVIDKKAIIHPNSYIGPHSYIGRSYIDEGTVIHGNVYIHSGVKVGKNIVINASTVIGSEGITTTWDVRFPHVGGVVIEDNVWIGSNVSIQKGMLSDTVIGQGSAIGHFCNIGHQTIIGKHCFIVSGSVIGGSCHIGDYSKVSMSACIRDKIRIGKKAIVGMGSVVTKDVGDRWVVIGIPARKMREVS